MSRPCCPRCRIRLTPSAASYLVACPDCGDSLEPSALEGLVGFRLFTLEEVPGALPAAIAAWIPGPEQGGAGR